MFFKNMFDSWTVFLVAVLVSLKTTDAAITGWTTPTISGAASGDGTLSVAEDQATGTTIETYVATTDGTLGDYELVTTGTPFAVSTGGVLTITSALDFETTSSYTLEIRAQDAAASGTATIAVTVTDVNEAPTFAKSTYGTTIADSSAAGKTVFTASATDQDSGDTITYSIGSGDTNSHFAIGSSSGIVTVNTGVTLDASTTAGYALEIEAADNDGTPKTGTTTVFIAVTSCSGATTIFVSTVMILFASFLTMLQ